MNIYSQLPKKPVVPKKLTVAKLSKQHSNFAKQNSNFAKQNSCNNCVNLIKENGLNVCRLFKYSTVTLSDKKQFHYYMETDVCRSQQDLCGPHGYYFKPKNLIEKDL